MDWIEPLKPLLFIFVPILCWLAIGATFAYIGKKIEANKEKDKVKFED